MKKFLSLFLCTAILLSVLTVSLSAVQFENQHPDYADRYIDVAEDSWYYSAVSDVYMLMNGTTDENHRTVFLPEKSITREEFITVLYRLDQMAYLAKPHQYKNSLLDFCVDAEESTWYSDAVLWAMSCGVSDGVAPSLFGIGRNITREEAVTLLVRYYEKAEHLIYTAESSSAYAIKDEAAVSEWAKESVDKAYGLGLVHGTDDGNFEPQRNITRAETAQIFAQFFYYLDYDFEYVFSADNVKSLTFTKLTDGGKSLEYSVTDEAQLANAVETLSGLDPIGAKKDYTMEYTGPHYTVIRYQEVDGASLRNILILDESSLIVSGFKIYTFDEPVFKEYLDRLE